MWKSSDRRLRKAAGAHGLTRWKYFEAEFLLAQDVTYEDISVEIDRCGKCGGVWLDKGESDKLQPDRPHQ